MSVHERESKHRLEKLMRRCQFTRDETSGTARDPITFLMHPNPDDVRDLREDAAHKGCTPEELWVSDVSASIAEYNEWHGDKLDYNTQEHGTDSCISFHGDATARTLRNLGARLPRTHTSNATGRNGDPGDRSR